MDYTIWGHRELIERIEELEGQFKVNEKCAFCGETMYTTMPAHHHTEKGVDVTKAI